VSSPSLPGRVPLRAHPWIRRPIARLAPRVPLPAGPAAPTEWQDVAGPTAPPAPSRPPRARPDGGGAGGALVLTGRRRVLYYALTLLWLVIVARFWTWWLAPGHRGDLLLFVPASATMAYLGTVMPAFFWFYVGRMRTPPDRPAPAGLRVALITPCVPSHETYDVIEQQLRALAAVEYPHDSWILDEGGDRVVERMAALHGVRYFTRKGKPIWNQPGPPFQARTKAGNVNAWLDAVLMDGEDYDCFVQLDIDHRPVPGYLDRTLGHFDDPAVGWVQAPSVCKNLDSWTARGLAEQDLVLQGPLQMGFYGHSGTPFIIGSHTTYRTSAIREIGGYQPTRAEDHLDTVVLAAHGYRGVYVPEIIASGDGPEDFGTYLGQQFAWAFSMVQIFLQHTPRLVRRYSPRQAFQFLMAQSWYTLWSLSLAVLWLLPIVALLTGRPIATVRLSEFLLYHCAMLAGSSLLWWWARPHFQPRDVRLSWRGLVLELARWPVVLYAVVNVVLRIQRPYMITPKGVRGGAPPKAAGLYGPFLLLAGLGILALAAFHVLIGSLPTAGYVLLVLFDTTMLLVLLTVTLGLEQRSLRIRLGGRAPAFLARRTTIAGVAALWVAAVGTAAAIWPALSGAIA